VDILFANDIATYTVKKDQVLNEALSFPVDHPENHLGQMPETTAQETTA
jgi:hypothetical protein